jgi:hypothetical protein
MKKMFKAFNPDITDLPIEKFLKLTVEPRRRAAGGVECESWSDSAPSIFRKSPKLIAISLLNQAGIKMHPDLTIGIDFVHAWQELLKISEF